MVAKLLSVGSEGWRDKLGVDVPASSLISARGKCSAMGDRVRKKAIRYLDDDLWYMYLRNDVVQPGKMIVGPSCFWRCVILAGALALSSPLVGWRLSARGLCGTLWNRV